MEGDIIFRYVGGKVIPIKLSTKTIKTEADGEVFKQALVDAKNTQPKTEAWRVDTDSHDGKGYIGTTTYISDGGSTFSITEDGDIISVCINKNDTMKGYELLDKAVKSGGKKLDSFDGNFGFYLRNGFEPVSWVEFDEKYAPSGWIKGRDKPEPVVFFKYTGKKYEKQSKDFWEIKKNQFYKKVKKSASYDDAKEVRDKEV